MRLLKITYFHKGEASLCGNDFKNKDISTNINIDQISDISELNKFNLPFSRKYVASYGVITMKNNYSFCLREKELFRIINMSLSDEGNIS